MDTDKSGGGCASVKLASRAKSGLVRASFRFERFFPRLVKLYMGRQLKKYKERGTISDYRIRAKRVKKYHYVFEVDLFLDPEKGGE
ncbi:MAG: hypothetical protein ABSG92_07925 [Conexivisphaerales archaeon]